MAALEPINGLGDASPGFVWRLQSDDGDATSMRRCPTTTALHRQPHGVGVGRGVGGLRVPQPPRRLPAPAARVVRAARRARDRVVVGAGGHDPHGRGGDRAPPPPARSTVRPREAFTFRTRMRRTRSGDQPRDVPALHRRRVLRRRVRRGRSRASTPRPARSSRPSPRAAPRTSTARSPPRAPRSTTAAGRASRRRSAPRCSAGSPRSCASARPSWPTGRPATPARRSPRPRPSTSATRSCGSARWPSSRRCSTQPEVLPFSTVPAPSTNLLRHEPVGVVGAVIPWNFPLQMAAWKISMALAAGCTVVVKPAPETPATVTLLAEVLRDAGVPRRASSTSSTGRAPAPARRSSTTPTSTRSPSPARPRSARRSWPPPPRR